MSIDRYKVKPSSFERYYDVFLQNSLKGHQFKIVLESGETSVGVPTSASFANPLDPNVSFSFKTNAGMYRIPFAHLREAEDVEHISCMVRTVDPTTLAAADFEVLISGREVERLMQIDEQTTVLAAVGSLGSFVEQAPEGTYKYLTVGGRDYVIKTIKKAGSHLDISVQPL